LSYSHVPRPRNTSKKKKKKKKNKKCPRGGKKHGVLKSVHGLRRRGKGGKRYAGKGL